MKTFHRILGSAFSLSVLAATTLTTKAVTPGSLVAWGAGTTYTNVEPEYGQSTLPTGLAGATTNITAGVYHSVALKSDGTVVAWGDNTFGQVTGVASANPSPLTNTLPTAANPLTAGALATPATTGGATVTEITAIAAGGLHTLALRSNGSVVAWGAGKTTGTVPNFGQSVLTPTNGLTTVTTNATIPNNTTGLVSTVTVSSATGIVPGMSVTGPGLSITVGVGAKVISISGTTVTLSVPNLNTNLISTQLTFSTNVVAIAAGYYHSVALKSDGTVVAWGDNTAGQTTIPAGLNPFSVAVGIPANPTGTANTITTGTVVQVGMNVTGPVGTVGPNAQVVSVVGTTVTLSVPNAVNTNAGVTSATLTFAPAALVTSIAAGNEHTVARKSDGTVVAWGRNVEGQTSGLATVSANAALPIQGSPGTVFTVTLAAVNNSIVPGLLVTGAVGTVGAGATVVSKDVTGLILTLSVANTNSAAVGSTSLTFSPSVPVTAAAIAAGGDATYFLKADTTVTAQGDNFNGQTTIPAGLTGVTALSANGDHVLALKSDATVVAWGKIWNGTSYVAETIPSGLTGVSAIAAGHFHSVAIMAAPLIIVTPPVSVAVVQGGSTTFSVYAPGATSYQWQKDGVDIPGATNSTLTLNNVQPGDVGSYTVIVSNSAGSVISLPAVLTGIFTPEITSQPLSVVVQQPAPLEPTVSVSFDIKATGGSLSFQWKKNGVNITTGVVTNPLPANPTDPSSSILTLTNVTTADVGSYTVVVTNASGTVSSKSAALHVIPVKVITTPTITSSLATLNLNKNVPMAPYIVTANTAQLINAAKPSYSAKNLPKGLKIDSKTGVISGKPSKTGSFLVTLSAKIKTAGTATATKMFVVAP